MPAFFRHSLFLTYYPHKAVPVCPGLLRHVPQVTISFSDNINELSPTFVSLYNQASVAETNIQIYGLAGIGYRKSLEYLIKDYLIKIKHQDKDTIIKMDLGNCVNKLEGQIKTIAKASIWIGNDEIMKAAKELQTFKNTAEKKLPDKDIEEFH